MDVSGVQYFQTNKRWYRKKFQDMSCHFNLQKMHPPDMAPADRIPSQKNLWFPTEPSNTSKNNIYTSQTFQSLNREVIPPCSFKGGSIPHVFLQHMFCRRLISSLENEVENLGKLNPIPKSEKNTGCLFHCFCSCSIVCGMVPPKQVSSEAFGENTCD